MMYPDVKNLPDPYLPAQREVIRKIDRIAESRQRRRQALEQFEKRLAERGRHDRITLTVCFALLVIIPAVVWWLTA